MPGKRAKTEEERQQRREASVRRYQENNKERLRESARLSMKRTLVSLKAEILEAYGAYCACCGESEATFLTIDHINNDGAEERRSINFRSGGVRAQYLLIKRLGFPKDRYRVMCWNCNCGRERNGGICPHEAKRVANVCI